jgi:hypothetical protein
MFDPVPAGPSLLPLTAGGQVAALADVDPDVLRFLPAERQSSARRS